MSNRSNHLLTTSSCTMASASFADLAMRVLAVQHASVFRSDVFLST